MSQRVPYKQIGQPIPLQILRPLALSVAPARGELMAQNSSGYAILQSGSTPNTIPLGPADRDEAAGTSNGAANILTSCTFVSGYTASTSAGDSFSDSDFGVVAWGKDQATPGKLSNLSGANRSMLGIVYGLDYENDRTPIIWTGPVAHSVARGVHMADNACAGLVAFAADASATTDQGSATDPILIPRDKRHGRISTIEIIPSADLAASGSTNYATIAVYKIDTLTNTVSAVVGTFTTATQALAKRTPTQFTLTATSALLDMLETDVLGYARLHGSSGASIPQSIIRANMKVQ